MERSRKFYKMPWKQIFSAITTTTSTTLHHDLRSVIREQPTFSYRQLRVQRSMFRQIYTVEKCMDMGTGLQSVYAKLNNLDKARKTPRFEVNTRVSIQDEKQTY